MKNEARRWYDAKGDLARQLDSLMKLHPKDEFQVIKGLVDLIREHQPEILSSFTIPDDVESWYRRWYDKDPTYWLVFNGLKHANESLLEKTVSYLRQQLDEHKSRQNSSPEQE